MTAPLRALARRASARHRRWDALLASLTLDPDALPDPLPPPGPRDVLLCGSPRSGTALLTAALFQPPRSISVMEPWDALRLPPRELFASLREEIAGGVLSRGRLDVEALRRDGSVTWCRDGERPVPVAADPDHLLAVKLPAFWRYVPRLHGTRFVVCLRHPYEVVRSYRESGGRLSQGLEYDAAFHRRLNAELSTVDDLAQRRVALYDAVHRALLPHLAAPDVLVVRYERWSEDRSGLLTELSDFLGEDLRRSPVVVRRSRDDVDPADREAVRRWCTTAEALGYAL